MVICRAIETDFLTQGFGANFMCESESGKVIWVNRNGRCPDKSRPLYAKYGLLGHNAKDWATYFKEPVYFPVISECKDWIVRYDDDKEKQGGMDVYSTIRLYFNQLPRYAGSEARSEWERNNKSVYVKFRFWHAWLNILPDGDTVKMGYKIQLSNSRGLSTGNHVHFGMKIVSKSGVTLDRSNGYGGAVDTNDVEQNIFILNLLDRKSVLTGEQQIYRAAYGIRYKSKRAYNLLMNMGKVYGSFNK